MSKLIILILISIFLLQMVISENINDNSFYLDWQRKFWEPKGHGFDTVVKVIVNALKGSYVSADSPLSIYDRNKIAEDCLKAFSRRDPFGVAYDDEGLKEAAQEIKEQTIELATRIFHEKELFRTSQN